MFISRSVTTLRRNRLGAAAATLLILAAGLLGAPIPCQARAGDATALTAEFDPAGLNAHELRTIQRALVFTGDYDGLIDGKWGPISQKALENFSIREFDRLTVSNAAIAALLGRGLEDMTLSGAEVIAPNGYHLQIELPMTRVRLEESGPTGFTYRSPTRDLAVLIERHGQSAPIEFHSELRRNFIVGAEPYLVDREQRLVSSFSADGFATFVRSDLTPIGWVSVSIFAKGPDNVRRLKIIASTISFDPDTRWLELERPSLMRIIDGAGLGFTGDVRRRGVVPASVTEPNPDIAAAGKKGLEERGLDDRGFKRPQEGQSTGEDGNVGTGFYVSPTEIVTNNHVVSGCSQVETGDGAPLRVVYRDPSSDLALLSSSRRSTSWLAVSPRQERMRLGVETYVLGFPYYGLTTREISFTRGVISSRTGLGGSPGNFTLTAPMQPGNSGGPVLDRSGSVIGVAVARISDFAVAEATGTLPQNINYAVTGEELNAFLEASAAAAANPDRSPTDLRENGVPDWIEQAVLPVVCR